MRVRILYAPPQTGHVCGSVIETTDEEATVLVGNDLAEETEAKVTHDAPPVFYTATPEAPAEQGKAAAAPVAGGDGKPPADVTALEAAAKKAADTLGKLKAAHAKATGRAADALAIKVAAAEKKLSEANAAVAAAKGE